MSKTSFFVILFFTLFLSGCTSYLTPRADPSHFYVLEPTPSPVKTEGHIAIQVAPVAIPAYLERPQIVTRVGEDEIKFAEWDRWAECLRAGIRRVVSENLKQKLASLPKKEEEVYRLYLQVLHFEGTINQEVVFEVRWHLETLKRKRIYSGGKETITKPTSGGYSGYVRALSDCLEVFSEEVAQKFILQEK